MLACCIMSNPVQMVLEWLKIVDCIVPLWGRKLPASGLSVKWLLRHKVLFLFWLVPNSRI